MLVVNRGISIIHCIGLLVIVLIGPEHYLRGTCSYANLIKISNVIGFEEHRIVINGLGLEIGRRESGLYFCPHSVNRLAIINVANGIVWVGSPSAEMHISGKRSANSRVVHDRVEMFSAHILWPYEDSHHTPINLVEVHLQAGTLTTFRHNIHRETLSREGDGVVGRGDRGHKLVAVGALVIDVQQLAVRKVGVGNGDHHRLVLLRLPVGIAVVNGNVVGALHLLALRQGALHLGGTHRGLLGHLAHHLELGLRDLLLDGARLVGLRRTAVLRHHRRHHVHCSEKEQKSKDRQQKSLHFSLGRCTCHTVYVLYYYLIINML